ncbi:aspartate carbamoyltransferase regulatory subunit [Candidatus Undinarchaeota archaeon]
MKENMIIGRIENGTVIDHIPGGVAFSILKILGIGKHFPSTVSVAMNVKSKQLGIKDMLKVENRELKEDEVDKLALVAPHATVNIIRNGKVAGKRVVNLPKELVGVVECGNPKCVTNFENEFNLTEPITSKFIVVKEDPLTIRCTFCERNFSGEDIEDLI